MRAQVCFLFAALSALLAYAASASTSQAEPRQMQYVDAPMGAGGPPMTGPGLPPPGMGAPYPPFPLKDPGFSVTHGYRNAVAPPHPRIYRRQYPGPGSFPQGFPQNNFEGFLVPSSWLGGFGALLPWGIEGLVILGGIIVFTVIIALVILCLLSWWPEDWWRHQITSKKDDKDGGARAMGLSSDSVIALTQRVLDAVEKYSEINLVTPTKKE